MHIFTQGATQICVNMHNYAYACNSFIIYASVYSTSSPSWQAPNISTDIYLHWMI